MGRCSSKVNAAGGLFLCAASLFAASCNGCDAPQEVPEVLPGWDTVVTDWPQLDAARRAGLQAFVWPVSIDKTERPTIYVRSAAPSVLRVFRLGWYDGAGARLMSESTLPARNAGVGCGAESDNAIIAAGERDFGLVECPWTDPAQPAIPGLESGMYMAVVTATIEGTQYSNVGVFYVRDDASSAPLVVVNPTDQQVYTDWSDTPHDSVPGAYKLRGLYSSPRSTKVSFNRPLGIGDLFKTDYPLFRFLEREGIPYTVATDYDLHVDENILSARRSAIISGHGEYWSYQTRKRLDAFVEQGGNVVAMASNTGYWQIRYEESPAGLPGPVVVGYKETATRSDSNCSETVIPAGAPCGDPLFLDEDPANDYLVTTNFRNPPVNYPEQLLFGVQYQLEPGASVFEVPVTLFTDEIASMRSLQQGFTANGDEDVGAGLDGPDPRGNIGWEADVIHPHALLQMSPTACLRSIGQSRWPWSGAVAADNQIHLVLYRPTDASGYVFGGLSMMWSWGLDDWGAVYGFGGTRESRVDPRLQTLTKNMLAAAEAGNFEDDCAVPIRLSYWFARDGAQMALFLKEDDFPGRWSKVPVAQQGADVVLDLQPSATAQLSGWAASSDAYDLFVADVDMDGDADLIAKEKHAPGHFYVARNEGSSFQPEPAEWLSGWAVESDAYDLFVADVDGDTRADLIAKEKHAPGLWYVARNNGSSFQPEPTAWLSGWAVESDNYDLFVAQLDDGGKADLIAKEKHAPGLWYVARNNGSSFQPEPVPWLSGWAVESGAYDLFVADVDGAGGEDLIAKEKHAPGLWYVARNNGSSFQPEATAWLGGWAVESDAYDLFVANLTGDNRADLVAREKGPPGNWYAAWSDGTSFQPQATPMLAH